MAAPLIAVTPKIQAQADAITAGISDRRQQAQKLYEWVSARIRYVSVQLGRGAIVPHSAEAVLVNGYGDCKDHTVIYAALLKAKEIDSQIVLINLDNAYSLSDVPTLAQLNHAITWLPEFKLYVDTTIGVAPFGDLMFRSMASRSSMRRRAAIPFTTRRFWRPARLRCGENGGPKSTSTDGSPARPKPSRPVPMRLPSV